MGSGEDFVAATTDPAVLARVREQLALPEAQRRLHINGALERARSGQNLKWGWRIVPDRWRLVEISIRLCNEAPSTVERDIDYWVNNVKRLCPWSSYVKGIESSDS